MRAVQRLAASAVVLAQIAIVLGEDPKRTTPAIPKTVTVKEVLAIIEKAELTSQGCGGGTWNGEEWGFYLNSYKPLKLPWNSEPQRVKAGFAYGIRNQTHLIQFTGPGFHYERLTDVPHLTLKPAADPK